MWEHLWTPRESSIQHYIIVISRRSRLIPADATTTTTTTTVTISSCFNRALNHVNIGYRRPWTWKHNCQCRFYYKIWFALCHRQLYRDTCTEQCLDCDVKHVSWQTTSFCLKIACVNKELTVFITPLSRVTHSLLRDFKSDIHIANGLKNIRQFLSVTANISVCRSPSSKTCDCCRVGLMNFSSEPGSVLTLIHSQCQNDSWFEFQRLQWLRVWVSHQSLLINICCALYSSQCSLKTGHIQCMI